jgi:hypothetical protein
MADELKNAKIDNLLDKSERALLKELAKLTKEYELCEGYHRKKLFVTGAYNKLYLSNIAVTCQQFSEIYLEIEGSVEESMREQLLAITAKLRGGFTRVDDIRSYHQHRAGLMDPEDIFLFAESLIGSDNQEYALELIGELESEFGSDHKVILGLRKQIA